MKKFWENDFFVAPHWGAWIEMVCFIHVLKSTASHPTGVRGLKYGTSLSYGIVSVVAPHWGAWIEINAMWQREYAAQSHPTGVRGLKLQCREQSLKSIKSHPTGVRGLKSLQHVPRAAPRRVAPHWGAWIEIQKDDAHGTQRYVAPHWGAWIEIPWPCSTPPNRQVAPHWGAWIEIQTTRGTQIKKNPSHPTGVRGLKFQLLSRLQSDKRSHPTGVRGLKYPEVDES